MLSAWWHCPSTQCQVNQFIDEICPSDTLSGNITSPSFLVLSLFFFIGLLWRSKTINNYFSYWQISTRLSGELDLFTVLLYISYVLQALLFLTNEMNPSFFSRVISIFLVVTGFWHSFQVKDHNRNCGASIEHPGQGMYTCRRHLTQFNMISWLMQSS